VFSSVSFSAKEKNDMVFALLEVSNTSQSLASKFVPSLHSHSTSLKEIPTSKLQNGIYKAVYRIAWTVLTFKRI
jgi:hypothetical protein